MSSGMDVACVKKIYFTSWRIFWKRMKGEGMRVDVRGMGDDGDIFARHGE